MNTLENVYTEFGEFKYLSLEKENQILYEFGIKNATPSSHSVYYEKKEVGNIQFHSSKSLSIDETISFTQKISPLFIGNFNIQKASIEWISYLKKELLDDNASWVGIYWKESFIQSNKKNTTDLILGPFMGFVTPHVRISLQKGLCGRAIRENKTLNIDDVNQSPEYLSCSIETKSEIIIPLRNSLGEPIGELDIDSKVRSAFDKNLETKLEMECKKFEKVIQGL